MQSITLLPYESPALEPREQFHERLSQGHWLDDNGIARHQLIHDRGIFREWSAAAQAFHDKGNAVSCLTEILAAFKAAGATPSLATRGSANARSEFYALITKPWGYNRLRGRLLGDDPTWKIWTYNLDVLFKTIQMTGFPVRELELGTEHNGLGLFCFEGFERFGRHTSPFGHLHTLRITIGSNWGSFRDPDATEDGKVRLYGDFISFLASAQNLKTLCLAAENSASRGRVNHLLFYALCCAINGKTASYTIGEGLENLEDLELRFLKLFLADLLRIIETRRTPLKRLMMAWILQDIDGDQPTNAEERIENDAGAEHLEELLLHQCFAEHPHAAL